MAVEILSRRGGLPPDDGKLEGELDWLVKGDHDALSDIAAALRGLTERIGDTLLVSFGNAVGIFEIPHYGRVEVISGKWSSADFDAMLANLTDIASALPFHGGQPAALPYDRSVAARQDFLYSIFVYVRHILSDAAPRDERLLPALSSILADPHRRLKQELVSERLERARGVDSRTLERLASQSGPTVRASGRQAAAPIALALRGHLPERVEERRTFSSLDTAENRFIKSFLQMLDAILDQMEIACRELPDAFARRTLADCDRLRRRLAPFLGHRMWSEVGPMIHLPASSTILQRRRGYRQVFQHFSRLRLAARVPLDRELVRRLLEVRNVAELYELWCFFTVVSGVEELLGPPSSADVPKPRPGQLAVYQEFRVSWPNGASLFYNRSFHPSKQGSYSVPLRPDIALSIPGAGMHLFDAKFRLKSVASLMDEIDDEESARGSFQKADLYKMHTYRDAIPGARSVWVLYPGSETCFFGIEHAKWNGTGLLSEPLEGVGAISLIPGRGPFQGLQAVLSSLLQAGGPCR